MKSPDLEQTRQFLNALAVDGSDSTFCFQVFDDRKNGGAAWHLTGTLDHCLRQLIDANAKGGGVFVTVNRTDGGGRTAENVTGIRSLFVDLDGAPLDPAKACRLKPHIVVESSPGRYHAYWKVADLAVDKFTDTQKTVIARFQGDAKVHDLPRVMRLPGFWHQKSEPFLSMFIEHNHHAPFTAAEIAAEFAPLSEPAPKRAEPLPDKLEKNNRRPQLFSLAGSMRKRGATEKAILAALTEENVRCSPPLPVPELQKLARGIMRYEATADIRETDAFSAEFFIEHFGKDLRYDHTMGCWLRWDGTRWDADRSEAVFELGIQSAISMRAVADAMEKTAAIKFYGFARASENRRKISDMLFLAGRMTGVATTRPQLDVDPLVFNCQNGTLCFHGKEIAFHAHRQEDLLTKRANVNYDPEAACPRWTEFVNWCACDDAEIVAFLARFTGVCLTGHALQFLVFPYGLGANGKSVFWNALVRLLGDYATKASFDLLTKEKGGIPNDVAALHGVRLAVCSEIPAGARVNESMLKDLTGGDIINARFLRQEFFQFSPTHKLMVVGNHRPRITGGTEATWRRLVLAPFLNVVRADCRRPMDDMIADFLNEGAGILNWFLTGLRDFWAQGFVIPEKLRIATAEYRNCEDTLADFVRDHIVVVPGETPGKDIYARYKSLDPAGRIMSSRALFEALRERGFQDRHGMNGIVFAGIGLKPLPANSGWES